MYRLPIMKNGPMKLGTFTLSSGTVIVSDPCYVISCKNELKNIKKGDWVFSIEKKDFRVILMTIKHLQNQGNNFFQYAFSCSVDSGQLGIFDKTIYPATEDNSIFYEKCCDLTLSDIGAGIIEQGVVSSSGYGDGCYDVTTIKNGENEIIAIQVIFVESNEN